MTADLESIREELAGIKSRAHGARVGGVVHRAMYERQSAADMPRLVAALEAVVDLLGEAPLGGDFQTGYMQAMRDVREAITAALTETKEPSDG